MPLQTNCAAFKAVESLAADFVECLNCGIRGKSLANPR